MSGADGIIVAVVGLSTAIGLVRGLAREVMSVIVWVTAVVAALLLGGPVARVLEIGAGFGTAAGFAIVFVAVLIAGAIVQRMLAKLVRSTGIGGTDRMLGSLFGALRGGLVVLVALIALRPFAETTAWWLESALVPELLAFENDVLELLQVATGRLAEPSG